MVGRTTLNAEEAAAYLNISERHIRRLVHEGRLAHLKFGSLLRFLPADLDSFIAASRVSARR
jgi:excisionase family DNA binding protein